MAAGPDVGKSTVPSEWRDTMNNDNERMRLLCGVGTPGSGCAWSMAIKRVRLAASVVCLMVTASPIFAFPTPNPCVMAQARITNDTSFFPSCTLITGPGGRDPKFDLCLLAG